MPIQFTISDTSLRRFGGLLAAGVVIVVVGLVIWSVALPRVQGAGAAEGTDLVDALKSSSVHAVTLDNDRVYFGRLHVVGDGFIELRRAYFIREAGTGKDGARQRVVSVSEIATEPDDDMLINMTHITHVQELKASSQVARAIKDLEEN